MCWFQLREFAWSTYERREKAFVLSTPTPSSAWPGDPHFGHGHAQSLAASLLRVTLQPTRAVPMRGSHGSGVERGVDYPSYPAGNDPCLQHHDPRADRLRTGACAAVAGVAASVPVMVWWAVGDVSTMPGASIPDYLVGPYHLGATPGRVALIAAAIVLVAGLADLVRRQIRREFGWTA